MTDKQWEPKEERDRRVKALQDTLIDTIRQHPIPAEEVVAALGGVIVYIVGLNTDNLRRAHEIVGQTKRQIRDALEANWPRFVQLRSHVYEAYLKKEQEQGHEQGNKEDTTS